MRSHGLNQIQRMPAFSAATTAYDEYFMVH
jgi:hypothetical protein